MQEMDALNCQFYETRVAKVNYYHYRRRRFAVYRRRALITKSPSGDKVIIEREGKKVRLVAYLQNRVRGSARFGRANPGLTLRTRESDLHS